MRSKKRRVSCKKKYFIQISHGPSVWLFVCWSVNYLLPFFFALYTFFCFLFEPKSSWENRRVAHTHTHTHTHASTHTHTQVHTHTRKTMHAHTIEGTDAKGKIPPHHPPSWNRYGPEVTFLCMRWGRGDHCYRIYVQPHHYPLTPRKSKKMFPPPPFLNWLLLPCFFHISILVWLWPFHEYCCCSLEKRKNTFFSIQVFVVSVKADTSILQNKDCKQIITMFWCQNFFFLF